jgi:hypothetical protein
MTRRVDDIAAARDDDVGLLLGLIVRSGAGQLRTLVGRGIGQLHELDGPAGDRPAGRAADRELVLRLLAHLRRRGGVRRAAAGASVVVRTGVVGLRLLDLLVDRFAKASRIIWAWFVKLAAA